MGGRQGPGYPFSEVKQGPVQLGDTTIDPELKEYYALIEELTERARQGSIDKAEFKKKMRDATIAAILLAFLLGGGSEDVAGATERLNEQRRIANESVDKLADDIYSGEFEETPDRTDGAGRDKLLARVGLWAVALAGVYSMSQVHTPPKVTTDADGNEVETEPVFEWVLGGTIDHCTDCLELNGQTHTAAEWRAAGIEPQSPDLECGGWNCDCRFELTDSPSIGSDF